LGSDHPGCHRDLTLQALAELALGQQLSMKSIEWFRLKVRIDTL
jgi:hypothetical protein